jgi:hypothetical protein
MEEHPAMLTVLSHRSQALRMLKKFWSQGDLIGLFSALGQLKDPPLCYDMLSALSGVLMKGASSSTFGVDMGVRHVNYVFYRIYGCFEYNLTRLQYFCTYLQSPLRVSLSLDAATPVLRVCVVLLQARIEQYAHIGLEYLVFILTSFTNLLINTLSNKSADNLAPHEEERYNRASRLLRTFEAILPCVRVCIQKHTALANQARNCEKEIVKLVNMLK